MTQSSFLFGNFVMCPQWPASQQLSTIVYLLLLFWWSRTNVSPIKAKSGLGWSCSLLWICCITKLKTKHWLGGAHDVRSTGSISLENPSPVSQQCLALWVQAKPSVVLPPSHPPDFHVLLGLWGHQYKRLPVPLPFVGLSVSSGRPTYYLPATTS